MGALRLQQEETVLLDVEPYLLSFVISLGRRDNDLSACYEGIGELGGCGKARISNNFYPIEPKSL